MFPPSGGNDPRAKQVTSYFNRPRPGGLAQGSAPAGMGVGAGAAPPSAGSVGEHLAEAYRGIASGEPGAMESLRAFFMALQQLGEPLQNQSAPEQGAPQRPAGFPAIAPNAAQSVPNGRAPLG